MREASEMNAPKTPLAQEPNSTAANRGPLHKRATAPASNPKTTARSIDPAATSFSFILVLADRPDVHIVVVPARLACAARVLSLPDG